MTKTQTILQTWSAPSCSPSFTSSSTASVWSSVRSTQTSVTTLFCSSWSSMCLGLVTTAWSPSSSSPPGRTSGTSLRYYSIQRYVLRSWTYRDIFPFDPLFCNSFYGMLLDIVKIVIFQVVFKKGGSTQSKSMEMTYEEIQRELGLGVEINWKVDIFNISFAMHQTEGAVRAINNIRNNSSSNNLLHSTSFISKVQNEIIRIFMEWNGKAEIKSNFAWDLKRYFHGQPHLIKARYFTVYLVVTFYLGCSLSWKYF